MVITRFAPSPTGHLHLGGARTALFCWAFAQQSRSSGTHGRFLIRIEDTDQARSSDDSARGILEDLAWLGLAWDDGPTLTTADGHRIAAHARNVGPYFQAQRVSIYNRYLHRLIEQGRAYPAFESSAELEAKRKSVVARKETYRYDRAEYRRLSTPEARLEAMRQADANGTPYVVRFLMPDDDIVVHDQVLGDVRYAAGQGGVDDFVIRKADGFPTYHFAVVIDDELMGVTHVLRAQEHLNNTPRHVALQKALTRDEADGGGAGGAGGGTPFRTPVYAHMPLIFNMDGTKMSKRDKAKSARKALKDAMGKDKALSAASVAASLGLDEKLVSDFVQGENDSLEVALALAKKLQLTLPEIDVWDFRQSGYLPEAITNFIALLGWNPGLKLPDGKDLEKFDLTFLASHFSIERIGKTNAKFDRAKLLSFNADAIGALSDEEFVRRWREYLSVYEPEALAKLSARGPHAFDMLAPAIKPRAKTLRDGLIACRFAIMDDDAYSFDPKAIEKIRAVDAKNSPSGAPPRSGVEVLGTVRERLVGLDAPGWTPPAINALVESLAQELGLGMGQIAQPLRVALTGTGVSPGIGETLATLGRTSSLARIDRCLRHIGGFGATMPPVASSYGQA